MEFIQLYSLAVEACVLECDYVTAYRLLGIYHCFDTKM